MTKLSYTKLGNEFSLEVETLPPAALAYLLQYGFSQSLQDSVAGRAKAVREEIWKRAFDEAKAEEPTAGDEAWRDAADLYMTDNAEKVSDEIDMDVLGTMQKRFDAILAGTVATRAEAAPKDPYAAIIREALQAAAKAKGKKLPKADSDDYKRLAGAFREAKGDWLAEELARRQAAVAGDFEIDL